MHDVKSQSAMEYLMSYGWAVLVIAVVLAGIYSLGLFNSLSLAPRAPPGACQVSRPYGPGTSYYIATAGECSGQLPQYVAEFDGASSYIAVNSVQLNIQNKITVSLWMYLFKVRASDPFQQGAPPSSCSGYMIYSAPTISEAGQQCGPAVNGPILAVGKWYNVVGTYDGSTMRMYINGALYGSTSASVSFTTGNTIYMGEGHDGYLNGYISNVQVYGNALTANQIQYAYTTGIGGAPVVLSSLVGWWPLNGNTYDYSGDGLNATSSANVIYTSQWTNGYTIT